MGKTIVSIKGCQFLINGAPVYSELPGCPKQMHGLLFNQRLIQGIFDDVGHRERYQRAGFPPFDPDENTACLIASLPEWYACGMRAFTIGLQGGGPVGLLDANEVNFNPYGIDGTELAPDVMARLDQVIRAADEMGMVVIVNLFYCAQVRKMKDGRAIRRACINVARFCREKAYTNILFDVANEFNIDLCKEHQLINTSEGIITLIDLVHEESGGMLTACSGGGGMMDNETAQAGDFVLIHGNGLTQGEYSDFVKRMQKWVPDKPVLCNEDSPCFTRLDAAARRGSSWGYYNNYTKQIPPCDFRITRGEDTFFARRMMRLLHIPLTPLPEEEQYVLQGLNPEEAFGDGMHAVRLAAEYPETIKCVRFLVNGTEMDISWCEPFFCDTKTTWYSLSFTPAPGDLWRAEIELIDGRMLVREQTV